MVIITKTSKYSFKTHVPASDMLMALLKMFK